MNKFYIIPGYGETTRRKEYQLLKKIAQRKGYSVIPKNPNWKQPITEQIFPVESDAILFGFSMGAILAYAIALEYPCKKIILASMTPSDFFSSPLLKQALGSKMVKDLKKIDFKKKKSKTKLIRLYGEKEVKDFPIGISFKVDYLIPNSHHELTKEYLKEVGKQL